MRAWVRPSGSYTVTAVAKSLAASQFALVSAPVGQLGADSGIGVRASRFTARFISVVEWPTNGEQLLSADCRADKET